jgi:NAD+ synthase (glutamine-hydrolysing)
VIAQGSQFSLNDVEVIVATIDLEEVRAYRSSVSRCFQAAKSPFKYHRIQTSFELSSETGDLDIHRRPSLPMQMRMYSPEEEIALCAGSYLWDVSHVDSYALSPADNCLVFKAFRYGGIPCATLWRD